MTFSPAGACICDGGHHHWRAGDLGFWDNRVTQHSVVGDFGDQDRVIQRITIRGDKPV